MALRQLRNHAALGFIASIMFVALASAHPGSGIAITPDGTIYIADVSRETIWKIAADGKAVPLLRDHWTHDVKLAADGSLYYEVEGDSDGGPAPRSLWRQNPDGTRENLIPFTHDFASFAGEPFAVDQDGNVFFSHMERGEHGEWRALIRRRTPSGDVTTLAGSLKGEPYRDGTGAQASFRIITAMCTGIDGAIYVLDRNHVRRVSKTGEVRTIATGLIDANPVDPPETRGPPTTINRLYGLCAAADGSMLIAYQAGRRVIRVTQDGQQSVVHRSESHWSPIGVAQHNSMLYVLEVGDETHGPRVVRVDSDGHVATVVTIAE